jgi:hypothetical protein
MKARALPATFLIVAAASGFAVHAAAQGASGDAPATSGSANEGWGLNPSAAPSASSSTETSSAGKEWDSSDVTEYPGQKYYFIGVRYRGDIVPTFLQHLFVDEGATVYSSTVGFEADIRKDNFSLIPALSFQEYGMDDTLYLQKGKDATFAGNYSYVHSTLKGIYATADMLWSTKVAKDVDFEYGFGVGVGVIFGDLQNNWVYQTPNGEFTASNGRHFTKCQVPDTFAGCNTVDHQNSTDRKVGNYVEKTWFGGGSVPNFFPWIALPQLGFRFKPAKQFEARLGFGFSLTGFWFGLSGDYGLESRPDTAPPPKTGLGPRVHY